MRLISLVVLSTLVCFNSGYIVERKEELNGHTYTIREDQPFFRVFHPPHFKVFPPPDHRPGANGTHEEPKHEEEEHEMGRQSQKKIPIFGHHHLPKGEKKDSANWPWAFRPYLPCMDLGCQCPAFKGKTEGNTCILPSGKPLKKAIRKEFRTLTEEERHKFMYHLHEMKKSGLYNEVGLVHRRSGVHAGPSFFPWHREFIKRLELVYRTFNTDMGLPYWDSTLDNNLPEPKDSVMFSKYLMGDTDEDGNVTYGAFHNWTTIDGRPTFQRLLQTELDGEFFNDARINFVLNQTEISRVLAYSLPLHTCINYTMDDRFLEYSHDYVHYYISGDMQERFSSSNDPIFIMHHGFVDSIWETWRQLRQTRDQREYQYPDDNPNCMPAWHLLFSPMPLLEPFRNIDALSNSYTDNLYEYAPRPTCRSKSEECGSEFLFCDTETNPEPKCSSKVKLGGNCSGFEWSKEVCYEGHCVQGRCVHKKDIEAEN